MAEGRGWVGKRCVPLTLFCDEMALPLFRTSVFSGVYAFLSRCMRSDFFVLISSHHWCLMLRVGGLYDALVDQVDRFQV